MARAFFQITSGPRYGLNYPLPESRPTTIGRKRGDLILEDPLVSSRHCRIYFKDDAWHVQDLGSTNGTLVDGRLVREARLRPGAEVTIGASQMTLYLGEDEVPTQSSNGREPAGHADIAWLLDEELVELRSERTRSSADVIGQDLRLPPGFNAVIDVVAGQDVGKSFRFKRGNVSVGRCQGEVPLSDVEVSRRHAVIEVFGREMIYLRDLGSTNGTYHNGRRVAVARLQAGDTVGCGKTVMKLHITDG